MVEWSIRCNVRPTARSRGTFSSLSIGKLISRWLRFIQISTSIQRYGTVSRPSCGVRPPLLPHTVLDVALSLTHAFSDSSDNRP